ncbi:MAG TPA: WbqC family protein [Chitinophagaceae bacterium]|nr:WbqC family protein [Chitinophagaceae bacterium]
MNKYIIDNQYFISVNYIKYLFEKSHINILSCEAYQKMSFRNRCIIAGSNGLINLSVPVENGRNQKCPFKDVRISYRQDWQTNHWRTLTSCYNKSAFFEYYRDWLEAFFTRQETFLFDLNLQILEWLKKVLAIKAEIIVVNDDKVPAAITDLRGRWLPKNFQSPEAAAACPRYFQVFEDKIGFQPNLSVLDALFNAGPATAQLLAS